METVREKTLRAIMSRKRTLPRGIRRQKSGQYQARITFESKQYGLGTFNTLQDAKARLAQAEADKSRGEFVPPKIKAERDQLRAQQAQQDHDRKSTPLTAVADDWLEWLRRAGRKEGTIYTYHRLLKANMLPVLGAMPVGAVTVDHINVWYAQLVEKHGVRVANKAYQTTARMFQYAMGKAQGQSRSFESYRNTTPCDIPEAARQHKSARKRFQVATADDVAALANRMPIRDKLMILLAGYNGLRMGEVLALRRSHVTTSSDGLLELHVHEQVQARGAGVRIEPPKSKAGIRNIPVHSAITAQVEEHLAQHVDADGEALLFPRDETGNRVHNPNTVGKRFRKALDDYCESSEQVAARLDGFRFHDLRHTALTRLGQAGATLADLMRFAGHSDVGAVLIYQHSERSRLAELTGH